MRILRHIALFLLILFAAGLFSATLVRLAPGFGVDERMLDPQLSRSSIDALAHARAEGSNPITYYAGYLWRLAHGDLGTSISLGRPVRELLADRLPTTARSLCGGLLLAWAGGAMVVVITGLLRRRYLDHVATAASSLLLCVPAAVIAVSCFYLGGTPALAIAVILFPRIFRYLQSIARQAAGAAHVLAARAFGENCLRILGWHIVVPALPQMLALAGISVSMAVGATIPVEVLCDSPGIGQLVWQASLARDLPVIVNVTLLITFVTVAANLAADTRRTMPEAST